MNIKANISDAGKLCFERMASIFVAPGKDPIFVFGNQKSGTSAISVLLGQATGLRTQMDFRGAWEPHLSSLLKGDTSIEKFVKRNSYAFSAGIVKEPGLTFVASEILKIFPNSKSIFIIRDPYQNIRSVLNRLKIPGTVTSKDMGEFVLPNATWRSIISGSDLGLTGTPVEIQAKRWCRAISQYSEDSNRHTLVRYEDFVFDKEGIIRNLALKVGLDPIYSISDTKDISFQKAGDAKVDIKEFFGEENFDRISSVCAPIARPFGYVV